MINERQLHEVINKYQLSLTREKKNHILKYSEVTEINLKDAHKFNIRLLNK